MNTTETNNPFSIKPKNIIKEWEQHGNKLILTDSNEWIIEHNFTENTYRDSLFSLHVSRYTENNTPYYINLSESKSDWGIFHDIQKFFNRHVAEIMQEYATKEQVIQVAMCGKGFQDFRVEDIRHQKAVERKNNMIEIINRLEKFLSSFNEIFLFKKYKRIAAIFSKWEAKNLSLITETKKRSCINPFDNTEIYY